MCIAANCGKGIETRGGLMSSSLHDRKPPASQKRF